MINLYSEKMMCPPIQKVPYRTIYPNATEKEWKIKNNHERTVRVVQLRNPNIEVYDMWPRDNSDDDDEAANGFLDQSAVRLDDSLLRQALAAITAATIVGVSQAELGLQFGLTKLHARTVVRILTRLGSITSYVSDASRQRTKYFILTKYKAIKDEMMRQMQEVNVHAHEILVPPTVQQPTIDVKCEVVEAAVHADEVPSSSFQPVATSHTDDIQLTEIEMKIVEIDRPTQFQRRKLITQETMTIRMAQRMSIIVTAVTKQVVVEDMTRLLHILISEEKRMGYKDEMCKRSIYRLLTKLCLDKRIRLWRINFKYKTAVKELMFVSEPSVEIGNPVLRSFVDKERYRFLLRVSNEKTRLEQLDRAAKTVVKPKADAEPTTTLKRRKMLDYEQKVNTPKFIRMRTLHETLFYLIYDCPTTMAVIDPDEAVTAWRSQEPRLEYDEIRNELSPVYSLEINWKMFVPPLMPYSDCPTGWTLMADIHSRLPLSIFVKIFNVNYQIDGLDALLMHPIRKHYLVNCLPAQIKSELQLGRRYVFAVDEVLRRCCCIGLVQMGPQRQKEKDQAYVYLNRHATVVDTIDSEPGYLTVTKRDYPINRYVFNSADDVGRYWHDLFRICMSTRLGKKLLMSDLTIKRWDLLETLCAACQPHKLDEAIGLDTGVTPGDGLGAGGLDSSFYAHLQRNWSFKKIRFKVRGSGSGSSGGSGGGAASGTANRKTERKVSSRVVMKSTSTNRRTNSIAGKLNQILFIHFIIALWLKQMGGGGV